eukprot:11279734-Ditylum_brightwellii.AAC.1
MMNINNGISNMKTAITNFRHSYNFNNDNLTLKTPDDLIISSKINSEINTLKSIVNTQEKFLNNVKAEVDFMKN